tara:strand:+ start:278367 stop:279311 length:945 start_codon:yes stop_codon:yes gene_type:complete
VPSTEFEPIDVELILATGSRAGLAASIMDGYYMIGRHADCQIRPKTRSVSRRHCVVFRENATFRVLDLESTSGTKINHERIEPKKWCDLKDGDVLSCGKICFQVSIRSRVHLPTLSQESAPTQVNGRTSPAEPAADPHTAGEMVTGEAWQAFDIADFLESQDDADREQRYDKIRQSQAAREAREAAEEFDEFDTEMLDSSDLSVYEDTPIETDENTSTSLRDSVAQAQHIRRQDSSETSATPATSGTPDRAATSARRVPGAGIGQRIATIFSGDMARTKLIVAFVVALTIIGFVASQAFEFATGPPVRVIDDLD